MRWANRAMTTVKMAVMVSTRMEQTDLALRIPTTVMRTMWVATHDLVLTQMRKGRIQTE